MHLVPLNSQWPTASQSNRIILPLFAYFLHFISSAVCLEVQTHLTSNVGLDKMISEGTSVTLTCSATAAAGSAVDARTSLRILRKRNTGGGMDGFEDLANVMSAKVARVTVDRPDITAKFSVTRKDDGAVIICGDAETLGFRSQNPSTSITIRVQFDPRSLTLRSSPEGGMREDSTRMITCQTDEGGANPPVNVTWRHLSPLGAPEKLDEATMVESQRHRIGPQGGHVTQSNLMIRAHRRLNGHRIECSIEKPGGIALLRQSETLAVIFAPNSVQINPSNNGGISEGDALSLTCAIAVSHPPATVRWFELPPGSGGPESGREITDLAQIDMTPGEYGGMLVESTFRVSKTFRSNSGTEYRCMVNQAALKKAVTAEYKLQIQYPPSVEIVSLPNDATEGQSVTLSCLAHGGMPDKGFTFSWWHSRDLQLSVSSSSPPSSSAASSLDGHPQDLSPMVAKSVAASLNASHVARLVREQMTQVPEHTGRHLLLDAISLEHTGWYACLVTNGGGSARGLHLLLINYAPRLHNNNNNNNNNNNRFIQYAETGHKAELVLSVDARPSRAEFSWFWVGNNESDYASKARRHILSQSTSQTNALRSTSTNMQRIRRSTSMKAISSSTAPWINRVKLASTTGADNSIKFSLAFREVQDADFGIYMCQLKHRAGVREFYFELKRQSNSKGVNPDSIRVTSEGNRAFVEFEPPSSQFYSRIVLRICLSKTSSSSPMGQKATSLPPTGSSGEHIFLRPVQDYHGGPSSGTVALTSPAGSSSTSGVHDCGDYEVTLAELGFLQVELDRPVGDYTFQFLVFRDARLRQITRLVRLNNNPPMHAAATSKFFVQLIIGILISLVVVCLMVFLIYYFCTCFKRRKTKKLAPANSNGLLNGPRTYQPLDSSKPYGSAPSGAGSISAELGLLHSAYANQSIGSSCQSAKGFYVNPPPGIMAGSGHPLLDNPYQPPPGPNMRGSPSNISHVSALTQRILSEVYLAAAKAASIAVSESIASGSMDAMNHAGGGVGALGGFRPGSQYAESVSMTGGSISALDGLSGYQGDSIGGTINRYPGVTTNGMGRMRKSSNNRVATPTYQTGRMTPSSPQLHGQQQQQQQLRQRLPPGSPYGWNSPPMLTTHATMRLNEAANALAAAAAAAVLEATGATPDLNPGPTQHVPRFGVDNSGPGAVGGIGGMGGGGHATSSEDGGSLSSNSIFPRSKRLASQDAISKMPRKKVVAGSRKSSLSNSVNEPPMVTMLAIPPNNSLMYPQMLDPRMARTPPLGEFTYFPVIPTDSLWTRNFQPITTTGGMESSTFSDLPVDPRERASRVTPELPIYVNPSTPTAPHRPPEIRPEAPSSNASEIGNPNDNTLRASNKDLKSPPPILQSPEEPPSPPSPH